MSHLTSILKGGNLTLAPEQWPQSYTHGLGNTHGFFALGKDDANHNR